MLRLTTCETNDRCNIGSEVSATDATLGIDRVVRPDPLQRPLFRSAEHIGEAERMYCSALVSSPNTRMPRARSNFEDLVRSPPWRITVARRLRQVAHVNTQEIEAVLHQLKDIVVSRGRIG